MEALGRSLALACLCAAAPGGMLAQSLPLGDGHVSDHPSRGDVYACRATFRGGGARHAGPWFHGDLWDPGEKPHVSGHVSWPDAFLSITPDGDELEIRGNGLPIRELTGAFPISPTDSVYRYDTNPNHVGAQRLDFPIPAAPAIAGRPGCLPMGMVGFTTTGVALYNALDDAGRDAAAHEIQDDCDGHPQANAQYHYHSASPCLPGVEGDSLVGWALDGFPILGLKDASGAYMTDADLDACHGRKEEVRVGGRAYGYAYHMTREYPYILGCFTGRVPGSTRDDIRRGLQTSRRRRPLRGARRPPDGGR
ncbi:MAG: YHYH protein [Candidatus Palauibacterales bacterium]|nr:YHYH protein [Candidatus Palauibacterales bacterium]